MYIRHTLLYLPANLVSTIVQFLAIIAWTHFLDPADLGRYNLVIVVQELVFVLLLWWWTAYTLRSLSDWREAGRRQRFERTEGFALLVTLCLHIITVAVLVPTTVDRSASAALIACSIAFAVSRSLAIHLEHRTRTSQQIALYTVLQISSSAAGFGAGLILVLMFGSGAVWPLIGAAAAQLLAAAYVMWRARVRLVAIRPDMEVLRSAVKFGFPLAGVAALGWVSLYGNRFIIEYFLGAASVGLYSVGVGLADRSVTFAVALIGAAALPLAIQDLQESGVQAAMQRLKTVGIAALGLVIPIAVGISVLASAIAEVLVGPQYREATSLLLPVAACSAAMFGAWCALPSQTLLLLKQTGLLVGCSSVIAVLSIILGIVLIQWFGILGVVYANLAAHSLVFVVACQICVSKFGMLFPGRELIKMIVCATLMAAVLWMVPSPRTLLGLATIIALGAAVYLSAAALLFWNEIRPIAVRWRLKLAKWTNDYRADSNPK
jgi:O-antigen/teichoic acid export membrane protein